MKPHKFVSYCPERYKEIENYSKAAADDFIGWECHHKLGEHTFSRKELKKFGLYYDITPNELVFLTKLDHDKIHKRQEKAAKAAKLKNTGRKNNEEQLARIAKATKEGMKQVPYEKLAFWKGKKQTEEQKAKKTLKIKMRRDEYQKYKLIGGTLKWNEWQKSFYGRN
jgi:hypothetical protein